MIKRTFLALTLIVAGILMLSCGTGKTNMKEIEAKSKHLSSSSCRWYLDEETETLYITGKGEMPGFFGTPNPPWFEDRESIRSVVIGDEVTAVGACAFEGCPNLTDVSFYGTSRCETIYAYAFSGCTSLERITIPNSVKQLNRGVFQGNTALSDVTFEKNSQCETLCDLVFAACGNLRIIHLPSSLKKIEKDALFTTPLTDIYYDGTEEEWETITASGLYLRNTSHSTTLHCTDVEKVISAPR